MTLGEGCIKSGNHLSENQSLNTLFCIDDANLSFYLERLRTAGGEGLKFGLGSFATSA